MIYPNLMMRKKKPASCAEVGFLHLNSFMRLPTSGLRWLCGAGAHKGDHINFLFFHNLSMANVTQIKFFVNLLYKKLCIFFPSRERILEATFVLAIFMKLSENVKLKI